MPDAALNAYSFITAASKWKEEHFKMLNIDDDAQHFYPIDIDSIDITPELSQLCPYILRV